MTVSIDSLINGMSVAECKATIYSVLQTLGMPTTGWRTGAVVRTIVALVAILYSAATQVMALLARSGFRLLAVGNWLTLVCKQVYNVDRNGATFATGYVTLVNHDNYVYEDIAPGDLVFSSTVTKKAYVNTGIVTINAGSTITIAVRAKEAGSASTAAPGQIDTMVTPLQGVTCSNAESLIGTDEETDEQLRPRADAKLDALSPNGPAGAYYYVATTARRPDGSLIGVTRVRVSDPSERAEVTVWVADADGPLSPDDLLLVEAAIQRLCVPWGITVTVLNAVPVEVACSYEAWLYTTSGLTIQQVETAIATALSKWVTSQPIGGHVISPDPGKLFRHAMRAVIMGVSPHMINVEMSVPAADIELAQNEVPVFVTPTPTINLVTP